MASTILVVDDTAAMRTLLREYLAEQGFRVETAADGRQALLAARAVEPDLVLLDVMMPELDGLDFLRHFRRERETPVILLTARVEETDKVIGLELGADDYVTKPFGMHELVARIRAVLRRTRRAANAESVLRAGDVTLDPERHTVDVAGEAVVLTPSEFTMLETLMAAPGRVYTRSQLLDLLNEGEGSERTIDVHVRNLRTKIEPDPRHPRYVETVFGVGYRFATD